MPALYDALFSADFDLRHCRADWVVNELTIRSMNILISILTATLLLHYSSYALYWHDCRRLIPSTRDAEAAAFRFIHICDYNYTYRILAESSLYLPLFLFIYRMKAAAAVNNIDISFRHLERAAR